MNSGYHTVRTSTLGFKWLLETLPLHTEALYDEAKRLIQSDEDVLIIDDSTFDKSYSHQIELVTRHLSGE